ncbi:MAG: hypothetical protein IJP35_05505 [Clostridia bacterium]|nr:hypothetical protein [Clostridia bacterium]
MNEDKLLDRLLKSGDRQRQAEIARARKDLTKAEKRLSELDDLFIRAIKFKTPKAPRTISSWGLLLTYYLFPLT